MNVFYTSTHTYRLESTAPAEFALTLEDPSHGHTWPSDELVSRWAGRPLRDSGETFGPGRFMRVYVLPSSEED